MGAPKQKWTPEEEAALRAGVEKYGAGKWRAIQKDPKFGPVLKSRSNVDLKDKWRNLSACTQPGHSRSSKVMGLSTPGAGGMRKAMDVGMSPLQVDSMAVFPDAAAYPGMREMSSTPNETSPHGPRYDDYILEAIVAMKHPGGSSSAAIANFVEERHMVPPNFRKVLNSKLKGLTLQGKLMKVDQNYKISTGSTSKLRPHRQDSDDEKQFGRDSKKHRSDMRSKRPKMDVEHAQKIVRDAEEAAFLAVRAVAEAEAAALAAEQAAREADNAEAEAEQAEVAAEQAALSARNAGRPNRKLRAPGGAFCNPLVTAETAGILSLMKTCDS